MATYVDLQPNWAQPVTERLTFKTDIFKTGSARERRESRRMIPAWTFRMSVLVNREALQAIMTAAVSRREDTILFPLPTVHTALTGSLAAGATVLPISPRPAWIKVDTLLELGGVAYRVLSLGSGTVTVIRHIGTAAHTGFPKGTQVRLIGEARLANITQVDMETTRYGRAVVELTMLPDFPIPYGWNEDSYGRVQNLIMSDHGANWRGSVQLKLDQERQSFETDTGPESHFWDVMVPTIRYWTYLHSPMSYAGAQRMLAFFCRNRGRARTFWQAGPASELVVLQPLSSTDRNVRFQGSNLTLRRNLNLHPQWVQFVTKKGTFNREIIAASEVGGNTEAQISTAFGVALEPSDFLITKTLLQSRFSEDTFEATWFTDTTAEMEIVVRSIDQIINPGAGAISTEVSEFIMTEGEDFLMTEAP